jgi:hypothetical protein
MAVIPTRRSLRRRLIARLRCLYWRWLITHAEKDLRQHQAMFEHASKHLPAQIAIDRKHIAELTKRLIREGQNL